MKDRIGHVENAKSSSRHSESRVGSFKESIGSKPAALFIIGLGAMWLLSGIRNPSRSVEDDRATSDPEWLKKKAPDDAASNTSVLSTKRIAAKLAAGTQDLSDEARRHVMEAREKAYHAREAVTRKLKQTQHKASNMFEEQPLLIGALAVALGSAIANAVPRTQVEDRALGDASDRLIAEAQAIFRNEQAQAGTQL